MQRSPYFDEWRAQGDDFRTFLNEFVADLTQFEFPAHFALHNWSCIKSRRLDLALHVLHAE